MREAAARAQCTNNLKQVGLGLHLFHESFGRFPAGTHDTPSLPPEKRLSWLASLLPYIEQDNVAKQIDWHKAWDADENSAAIAKMIPTYLCPGHSGPNDTSQQTHYVGFAGIDPDAALLDIDHARAGFFGYQRRLTRKDIPDGSSFTAAAMETALDNGPWAAGGHATVRSLAPDDTVYIGAGRPFGIKHKTDSAFRTHPIMANALFADGSVRSISEDVPPGVLRALVTIAGRDAVPPDF